MKKWNILLKLYVGFAILFVLFYKVGIKEVYSNLLKLNIFYIPLVVFIIFLVHLLGCWRFLSFLSALGIKMPFWKIYHYYFLSSSFGMFIPGRVGELSLVYFLKKENLELGIGSALVILDKTLGLSAVLVLSVAGSFLFFDFNSSIKIILIAVVLFIVAVYLILSDFGRKIIRKFLLKKFESKFCGFSKTLFHILKNNQFLVFNNFLFSFLKWGVNTFSLFLLFSAFGQRVSFLPLLLISSIVVLVSFVPISISGLGVKESVGVFLFKMVGVPTAVSSSVFIISLIITYLVAFVYTILFLNIKNFSLEIKKIFG